MPKNPTFAEGLKKATNPAKQQGAALRKDVGAIALQRLGLGALDKVLKLSDVVDYAVTGLMQPVKNLGSKAIGALTKTEPPKAIQTPKNLNADLLKSTPVVGLPKAPSFLSGSAQVSSRASAKEDALEQSKALAKGITGVLEQNRTLLITLSKENPIISKNLETFETQANSILSGEIQNQKALDKFHETLFKLTSQFEKMGIKFDASALDIADSVESLIKDSKASEDTKKESFKSFQAYLEENRKAFEIQQVPTDTLNKIRDINAEQLTFSQKEEEHIGRLLQEFKGQANLKDVSLKQGFDSLNKTLSNQTLIDKQRLESEKDAKRQAKSKEIEDDRKREKERLLGGFKDKFADLRKDIFAVILQKLGLGALDKVFGLSSVADFAAVGAAGAAYKGVKGGVKLGAKGVGRLGRGIKSGLGLGRGAKAAADIASATTAAQSAATGIGSIGSSFAATVGKVAAVSGLALANYEIWKRVADKIDAEYHDFFKLTKEGAASRKQALSDVGQTARYLTGTGEYDEKDPERYELLKRRNEMKREELRKKKKVRAKLDPAARDMIDRKIEDVENIKEKVKRAVEFSPQGADVTQVKAVTDAIAPLFNAPGLMEPGQRRPEISNVIVMDPAMLGMMQGAGAISVNVPPGAPIPMSPAGSSFQQTTNLIADEDDGSGEIAPTIINMPAQGGGGNPAPSSPSRRLSTDDHSLTVLQTTLAK